MKPALTMTIGIACGAPGQPPFSPGRIFLETPGIVFGDWAAHVAHNGRRGIADTVGPENPAEGWSVTHVPTGLQAHGPLLWEEEAINFALELSRSRIHVKADKGLSRRGRDRMWEIVVSIRNRFHPAATPDDVSPGSTS